MTMEILAPRTCWGPLISFKLSKIMDKIDWQHSLLQTQLVTPT